MGGGPDILYKDGPPLNYKQGVFYGYKVRKIRNKKYLKIVLSWVKIEDQTKMHDHKDLLNASNKMIYNTAHYLILYLT